ncbi:SubName: Full=Related to guanine nucleotide-binding protein alpha-4 subunit {ECO:0000313/EMBL:CCA75894.1} [Serendipita indica DSM 11827]|uniref:Related to guanine nucleotide-binding protein alpha-4 subunit n=1 Tax=Serendipita indica (strain DSM 11827) TaxID=1109443 RepID=G4TX51_SERID|nr:SubName: Full=Related to guanine nucleotide-binding protein alpha-4 subunit {ECO:0000313/EMBL:CCA75894.1} [Serendipita indica DSM 11827]CCA75894.1 related to guanine nucleotide-binding protein alpha-4 subunit [Serendipita indica DSM 11827]
MPKPANNRPRAESDPLSKWLQPNGVETPQEREARLHQEAQAKKISDAIDEQLRREKAELSKKKKEVRILLLGQSESGKSTTLKQFQLLYAPSSFTTEAPAWRPIIYLNLVRSVRRILEVITLAELDYDYDDRASVLSSPALDGRRPSINLNISDAEMHAFSSLRSTLSPLLVLEDRLINLLSDPDEESGEATHFSEQASPIYPTGQNHVGGRSKEVWVQNGRNAGGWKRALGKLGRRRDTLSSNGHAGGTVNWTMDPDDPIHVLRQCLPDMEALWQDPRVRNVLRARRIRLEESPGFYLNDMRRIVSSSYVPTIDDVLKARLKTLGVMEHRFSLDGPMSGGGSLFGSKINPHAEVEWVIYDVGGARNQRHVWAPFFDDVQALIFLAPISAFDQVLTEDPSVNRMEDSLLLWKSIVSNKLLKNVNLVLFLNKCDLLQQKLEAGTRLATYMTSYGDRPNDFESVSKYFRNKFAAMHQANTPNQERDLYIHMTSVVDTQATKKIITNVRDILLRDSLKGTNLL